MAVSDKYFPYVPKGWRIDNQRPWWLDKIDTREAIKNLTEEGREGYLILNSYLTVFETLEEAVAYVELTGG